MALEQITTDMDVEMNQKNPSKQKRKLASMKKEGRMDTELRSNVPVSLVAKEREDFAKAMSYADKKTKEEIKQKELREVKNTKPSLFNKPTMNVGAGTYESTSKFKKPDNIGHKFTNIKGGEIKVGKAIEVYNKYFSSTPKDDIVNYYIDEYLL
jgi:hypothetical protein